MPNSDFSPEIQQRITALPQTAQQFINGPEMGKVVQEIGTKHQLHIDKVGALEAEAMAAMIGITKTDEFTQNLMDALDLDQTKATAVAKDVNEQVFGKIREGMKASATPAIAPTAPTPPPPAASPAAAPNPVPVQRIPMASPDPLPAAPAPAPTIATPPVAPPAPKPLDVRAEVMLHEPTASVAPPKPVEKPITKVDPYREPTE